MSTTIVASSNLTFELEQIRVLRARYWRFVDTKKWADFEGLFAEDATFTDHSADFRCNGAHEIASMISAVLQDVVTIHHGHQSELELIDETHARGIWAMEDYLIFPDGTSHPTSGAPINTMRGYGHYFDQYVKLEDGWHFQKVELHRLRLEITGVSHTQYPEGFLSGRLAPE
jgi:hypothetical protein